MSAILLVLVKQNRVKTEYRAILMTATQQSSRGFELRHIDARCPRTHRGANMIGRTVPSVVFKTRVRDASVGGDNPYRWQDLSSDDIFAGKRVAVFSLPGAFTPVCSGSQCPDYERLYGDLLASGVDDVYCISVNDAFVMFQWARYLKIKNLKLLPDGNAAFTRRMGMLINKEHVGFGYRSWRYSMVVDDRRIVLFFEEPGINDEGSDEDPYTVTSPEVMLENLRRLNN
jgi:peroxiredoxin